MRRRQRNIMRTAASLCLSLFLAVAVLAGSAAAQGLIRDAETERMLRHYADPITEAAGLDPAAVKVMVINDNTINAFVAGGQNIFLNTGLIERLERPSMLAGVIAHETGHIAGGHLAQVRKAAASAQNTAWISTLLGFGTILAGAGQAGAAVIAAGAQGAQRQFLKYGRVQEAAADQAAVTYLERSGIDPRGLADTLAVFANQELLSENQQDPYTRFHPLPRQRVAALEGRIKDIQGEERTGGGDSPAEQLAYDMIRAKLHGFLDHPSSTLRRYKENDTSFPARYGRAIAWFRSARTKQAVAEINSMISEQPANPWLRELKGQVLFESGRVRDAIAPYQKSVELAPEEPLLRLGLAQAMIASEDPALNASAIQNLQIALRTEKRSGQMYRQLAIAHARNGDIGNAELATAEQYFLQGNVPVALQHAIKAQSLLPENSPSWLRAADIIRSLQPETPDP